MMNKNFKTEVSIFDGFLSMDYNTNIKKGHYSTNNGIRVTCSPVTGSPFDSEQVFEA